MLLLSSSYFFSRESGASCCETETEAHHSWTLHFERLLSIGNSEARLGGSNDCERRRCAGRLSAIHLSRERFVRTVSEQGKSVRRLASCSIARDQHSESDVSFSHNVCESGAPPLASVRPSWLAHSIGKPWTKFRRPTGGMRNFSEKCAAVAPSFCLCFIKMLQQKLDPCTRGR